MCRSIYNTITFSIPSMCFTLLLPLLLRTFSDDARALLNRMISFDPRHRPTFEDLELAAQGNTHDTSLKWLSGEGVCTLSDLYEELHERICGQSPGEMQVFINTKAKWKKVNTHMRAVMGFASTGKRCSSSSPGPASAKRSSSYQPTEKDDEDVGSSSEEPTDLPSLEEREMFSTATETMLSESAKDPMKRPVMGWGLHLVDVSKPALDEFLSSLSNELKSVLCEVGTLLFWFVSRYDLTCG